MSLDVASVFTAARDLDPAFDETATPPKPLLRYLSRYRDALIQEFVALYVDPVLNCTEKVDLPLADFLRGYPFPEHYYVRPERAWIDESNWKPFYLVQAAQLDGSPHDRPTGAIVGGRLVLTGRAEDWTGYDYLVLRYAPQKGRLEDADDPLAATFDPLPDYAEDALVAGAAWFMAKRDPGVDDRPFRADREAAMNRLFTTVTSQRRSAPPRIRERS